MFRILALFFRFLASTGLAVVLLLLLMLLTFLGTLQQVHQGLYAVQNEYFGSLFLVHWIGGVIPLPLPGAYLLLVLAFINVACGGIVRARKGWRHAGILIAHTGIVLLLAGGFVTFKYAVRGDLTLYEGDQADRFESNDQWEIVLAGPKGGLVIPDKEFRHLQGSRSGAFFAQSLPVDLTVTGYAGNTTAIPVTAGHPAEGKIVDGQYLKTLPPGREAEENVPGAYVTITDKATQKTEEHILAGLAGAPLTIKAGSEDWIITLNRRSWPLPFTVRLDKFTRELYPGTNIPKVFMSDVTKIEASSQQAVRISMNEPLRDKGYTLYQASWGPSNAGPHDRLFSTFAVVRNPAEWMPLYACSVIGIGLFVHFSLKLFEYLRKQDKARV